MRVWYNSDMRTPEGIPLNRGAPPWAQMLGGGLSGPPTFNDLDRTSHLLSPIIWTFSFVYVIVDQTQLHALSGAQFADYVAMVGLADIKPGAHLGDAPTILKLFDGSAQGVPAV